MYGTDCDSTSSEMSRRYRFLVSLTNKTDDDPDLLFWYMYHSRRQCRSLRGTRPPQRNLCPAMAPVFLHSAREYLPSSLHRHWWKWAAAVQLQHRNEKESLRLRIPFKNTNFLSSVAMKIWLLHHYSSTLGMDWTDKVRCCRVACDCPYLTRWLCRCDLAPGSIRQHSYSGVFPDDPHTADHRCPRSDSHHSLRKTEQTIHANWLSVYFQQFKPRLSQGFNNTDVKWNINTYNKYIIIHIALCYICIWYRKYSWSSDSQRCDDIFEMSTLAYSCFLS